MKLSTLAATVAVGLISVSVQASAQNIKVGFNGDISASPSAEGGQNAIIGIQAALDDINAAGGLLGKKVELVVRDDLGQPPKSIQNMNDLIDNEKVVAVFGPTNSGNALAWKHLPNQKKIPVLNPISSNTDITKPMSPGAENYMFRVSMVDRYQISMLLAYAKKNASSGKVGFLSETTGYGQGGLKDMQEIARLQGLEPVCNEKFGAGDTDMTSQLAKCKAAGAQTLVMWAQGTPTAQVVRSMEKIDYFPRLLTSWAADVATFADAAGLKLSEIPVYLRVFPPIRTAKQQQLYDRIAPKMKGVSVWWHGALAYDATMLWSLAVKQAGTTEGSAVRQALENLRTPYVGYTKSFERPFSPDDHEALRPTDLYWSHWTGGKVVAFDDAVVRSLKPEDVKR